MGLIPDYDPPERTKREPQPVNWKETRERSAGPFFLDSGAFSLYVVHMMKTGKDQSQVKDYSFYRGSDFREYLDAYAAFVKLYARDIDYYANVDVIYNPELSWEALKYLESEHGLHPVPVIHTATDLKWVRKHLDAGYEYIGIGGAASRIKMGPEGYAGWADKVFQMICPGPSRLPVVRTHGFALTNYRLMIRYPWWSVDSASWVKAGAYGRIYVPHQRNGEFTFADDPYTVAVSLDSPAKKERGAHVLTIGAGQRGAAFQLMSEWLSKIDVPVGVCDEKGNMVEWGVMSHHEARYVANLRFFEALRKWMPEWPWPLSIRTKGGLLR